MKAYKQRSGFAKIPHALFDVWGQVLGPSVSMVYMCIISHSSYKTQSGFPSYATIADKCGMTRRKAIDCVADLVFIGFIGKKACWHPDGDQDSNNYYVLDLPKIKDVIERLLRTDILIPKAREWIVKNLHEYFTTTAKKRDYENLVEARNTPLDEDGVVNIVHHGSEYSSPPVVNVVHQGGEYSSPKREILKEIHVKDTYLHTAKPENEVACDSPIETGNSDVLGALVWGSLLVSEEEKTFIRNELMKLSDTKLAQHIVDEVVTKYAAGKIKTSLAVYAKGLVNKANKGEFAPTNNLQLKRAEKAQKAITVKSNTSAPSTPKNFVAASTLVAGMKRMVAASGQRSIRMTPEEKEEMDKALAELAARRNNP